MNRVEREVQKKLVIFCKCLREFLEQWKLVLQESTKILESLCNQADQLRHVEKANIKDMTDFEKTKQILLASISHGIDHEISSITVTIGKLTRANEDLKNKLTTLENASSELDWEREGPLVKGGPTQPRLSMLLTEALEVWLFFKRALRKVKERLRTLDVRDTKSTRSFHRAFKIDLENDRIVTFLALIQYIDADTIE